MIPTFKNVQGRKKQQRYNTVCEFYFHLSSMVCLPWTELLSCRLALKTWGRNSLCDVGTVQSEGSTWALPTTFHWRVRSHRLTVGVAKSWVSFPGETEHACRKVEWNFLAICWKRWPLCGMPACLKGLLAWEACNGFSLLLSNRQVTGRWILDPALSLSELLTLILFNNYRWPSSCD